MHKPVQLSRTRSSSSSTDWEGALAETRRFEVVGDEEGAERLTRFGNIDHLDLDLEVGALVDDNARLALLGNLFRHAGRLDWAAGVGGELTGGKQRAVDAVAEWNHSEEGQDSTEMEADWHGNKENLNFLYLTLPTRTSGRRTEASGSSLPTRVCRVDARNAGCSTNPVDARRARRGSGIRSRASSSCPSGAAGKTRG